MIDYLQCLLGSMLVGIVPEHLLHFFTGNGSNGKSVLLFILTNMFGPYFKVLRKEVLLEAAGGPSSAGAALPHLMDLHNLRAGCVIESKENEKLNGDQMKSLTGGDMIRARPLYGDFVEWTPTH